MSNFDETVVVLADGAPLSGWLSVTVDQSFDKAAGQATVSMSEQPGVPMPMRLGTKAQVLIGGRSVIKGHVHDFNGEHDWTSHSMTVQIRDQTQDLIDSTVGPNLRIKSPVTLKQVADKTLETMGLSHIKVIDNISPDPFKDGEQVSASIDTRGFAHIAQYAERRQVLLNTDGNGSLVIDRNTKRRGPGALCSMFEDSPQNNVKKSRFRNSDFDRHNQVAVNGQKATNDKPYWEEKAKSFPPGQANPLQKNWGKAADTAVRPERRLHARGAKGLAGASPMKHAKWRSNGAKAKGFQYIATVQGFYGAPGWLWWPGFIIPVVDQHWEIEDELLIVEVRFHKDWKGGSTTDITCTLNDAFSIDESGQKAARGRSARQGVGSANEGEYGEADLALAED